MTQEEKELLLEDLSARLPYGVMVHFEGWNPEKLSEINLDINVYNGMGGMPLPYLRPMDSMTEYESKEFALLQTDFYIDGFLYPIAAISMVNWLNRHHFDYNVLIPRGLALPAPEGMYD